MGFDEPPRPPSTPRRRQGSLFFLISSATWAWSTSTRIG